MILNELVSRSRQWRDGQCFAVDCVFQLTITSAGVNAVTVDATTYAELSASLQVTLDN